MTKSEFGFLMIPPRTSCHNVPDPDGFRERKLSNPGARAARAPCRNIPRKFTKCRARAQCGRNAPVPYFSTRQYSRDHAAGSSERDLKQHRGHDMAKWSPPDGEGGIGSPLLNWVVQLAPLVVGVTVLFKQKKL